MERNRGTRLFGRLAASLLCVAAAGTAFASDLDWRFSTSLNYDSGYYGTDLRTTSLYVPFTVKRYWGDWDASLTMPYLSQTSDGRVTNVGGNPVRVRGGRGPAAPATESGPGDAIVRGGYELLHADSRPFDLSAVAKIKVPTADKDKGLGTGEFDEGVGLEFGKRLVPGWTMLADLYFTLIGDPPGTNLNNQVAVDFGFADELAADVTVTVLFETSNALVSGQRAPADLRGVLDYKVSPRGGLFVGGLAGLSDGSPDYGFSAGGSYRF